MEDVAFESLRENWTVCRVPSGTLLRMKAILAYVGVDEDNKIIRVRYNSITSVSASKEDYGPPTPDLKLGPDTPRAKVDFEPVDEPVNLYELTKIRVLLVIKPVFDLVERTEFFRADGVRFYRGRLRVAVAPVGYPSREQVLEGDIGIAFDTKDYVIKQ